MRMDDVTGYLEPVTIRGFSAEMKQTFIARYTICSNQSAICKSLGIDKATMYDAVVLDTKFRENFIYCNSLSGRSKRLNDELVKLAGSEKQSVILDLSKKLDKYSPEYYK